MLRKGFLILILLGLSQSVFALERLALVIGNNEYRDAPLKNPVNDANAIAKVLRSMDFKVLKFTDVDRDGFEDALADFGEQASNAEIALIYYAGHAIQVDGTNYMIPSGISVKHRRDLRKLIDLQDLISEAQTARGLGVVLVDACRDNPFSSRLSAQLGRSVGGRGLARVEQTPSNVIVSFATKDGAIALDGNTEHSPYAQALQQYLPQPQLEIRHLFGKVRDSVQQTTNNQQLPYTYGSLGGDLWFLAGGGDRPKQETRQAFEPEMVFIKGGTFTMGSPKSETGRYDDEAQHSVTVGDFYMGKYEVTFAEWDACVADGGCEHKPDDEGWGRDKRPVINVSWQDANQYVAWLNRKTGKQYSLPTEAQWEYAARAGTSSRRYWGDDEQEQQACEFANVADKTAKQGRDWLTIFYCDDGYAETAPVNSFKANAFGLHDMLGNVREWSCSAYEKNYDGSDQRCATSDSEKGYRVIRGGSWFNGPRLVRSAYRLWFDTTNRNSFIGFRLSKTP